MNRNLKFLVIAVIFFILGSVLGYFLFSNNCPKFDDNNTYKAGWQAAKNRLENLGIINSLEKDAEMKRLSGTIDSLNNKKITLKIIPIEPLADPDLDKRIVIVDNNTKIFQITFKDQTQYNQELVEYKRNNPNYKNLVNTDDFPMPPSRTIKNLISIDKLSIGMKIIIDTDENIISAKEFTAKEITVQPN